MVVVREFDVFSLTRGLSLEEAEDRGTRRDLTSP
jgi:hypothetical protein